MRTDHFLPLLLECQTRKEQRNLPDAVAIKYAIMAIGDTLRGIFPAGQTYPNWDELVKELKPKFMPQTADCAVFVESEQWNMRGDWPDCHAVVQAYKLCLDSSLHPALMVNMIKALDTLPANKCCQGAQAYIPRRCLCTYVGSVPHG